jgi:UrcA family protein
MITETRLRHDSPVSDILIGTIAALLLLGLAPAAAVADPPTAPVAATRSAKVWLGDLDFSTPAGARVAYERVKRVAEHLCHDPEDPWSRYHAATYNACVRETVAGALQQIQAPAIAALEK